jgi:hypothetical protein
VTDIQAIERDLFSRFSALHAALLGQEASTGWLPHADWLRFAAFATMLRPGDPIELARSIRLGGEALGRHAHWYQGLATDLRFLIAAMVVRGGHDARRFAGELDAFRQRLHDAGLRSGSLAGWDALAAALLHGMSGGKPPTELQLLRIKAIHDGVKRHHWWISGPDDLPACVLLSFRRETADEVVVVAELIYHLLGQLGFSRGDDRQDAAHLLALTGLPAATAAQRAADLRSALSASGMQIVHDDYEAIASLCLLDHDTSMISASVAEYRRRLRDLGPEVSPTVTLALAADLAVIDLVRFHRDRTPITANHEIQEMLRRIHLHHGIAAIVAMRAASALSAAAPGIVGWPYGPTV